MYRTLLVILLLLHLFADFYIQTEKMAEKKKKNFWHLLLHCFFYTLVVVLGAVGFYGLKSALWLALSVSALHFAIDASKFIYLKHHKKQSQQKEKQIRASLYCIDQGLHCITIFVSVVLVNLWNISFTPAAYIQQFTSTLSIPILSLLKWLCLALFIWQPANTTIYELLLQYKAQKSTLPHKDAEIANFAGNANTISITVQLSESTPQDTTKAIEANAGKLIGTLERAIIALLLLVNQYPAIGLVLTAKSVARYEKLKEKNFAEYYLLGTLLSTLLVIAVYLLLFVIL